MKKLKDIISNEYGIVVDSIERIEQGIMSKVFKIYTDNNTYIFRMINSVTDCLNLWKINSVDIYHITPKLINNVKGDSFFLIESNQSYGLLQEFIYGKALNKNNIETIKYVAKATSNLSKCLQNAVFDPVEDKFDMKYLFIKTKAYHKDEYQILISKGIDDLCIATLIRATQSRENVIHGDLGTWNMLFDTNGVRIFDFGELRYGSQYFDFAAAFMSVIEFNTLSKSTYKYFVEVYLSYASIIDSKKLNYEIFKTYCITWILRGILAKIVYEDSNNSLDWLQDEIDNIHLISQTVLN